MVFYYVGHCNVWGDTLMTKLGEHILTVVYVLSVTVVTAISGVVVLIWMAALTKVCILYLFGGK
jgi:hypothetical protein